MKKINIDYKTVESFGEEWTHFNQTVLETEETKFLFNKYFKIFPWHKIDRSSVGFDLGCGSGRWAGLVAEKVGRLYCIDPSINALEVAKNALTKHKNITYINNTIDNLDLKKNSQDFGYSLGVLHHIPDTKKALIESAEFLRPGAPFLIYLYYKFDNRSLLFKLIWSLSEILRAAISRMPNKIKIIFTDIIAFLIYLPLARFSKLLSFMNLNPSFIPLSFYRDASFYTMRTDSRDRFGTPLEQRFTKDEILQMMHSAKLCDVEFLDDEPYWVAVGYKRGN